MRHTRCFRCGVDLTATGMERIPFNHSTGTRYFCRRCADTCDGYNDENGRRQSKPTAQGITISKEFEIPRGALRFIDGRETTAFFEARGWMATHDSTVWKEMKSPIFQGLQSITKTMKNIENRLNVANWADDPDYGTHTNVGRADLDAESIGIIRTWRETLLLPLQAAMDGDENGIRALYGRGWSRWAAHLSEWSSPLSDHTAFINLQHDTHIEFRLNKFQSAAQDNRVNKYAIETTETLADFANVVKIHRATVTGDTLRAANRKAAEKTARKLVKIWLKHSAAAKAAEA